MTTRELIDAGNIFLVRGDERVKFLNWLPDDSEHDAQVFDLKEKYGFSILADSIESWRIDPAKPVKLPKHRSMTRHLGNTGSTPWVQLMNGKWETITDINAPTLKEARNKWRAAILSEQAARP